MDPKDVIRDAIDGMLAPHGISAAPRNQKGEFTGPGWTVISGNPWPLLMWNDQLVQCSDVEEVASHLDPETGELRTYMGRSIEAGHNLLVTMERIKELLDACGCTTTLVTHFNSTPVITLVSIPTP